MNLDAAQMTSQAKATTGVPQVKLGWVEVKTARCQWFHNLIVGDCGLAAKLDRN